MTKNYKVVVPDAILHLIPKTFLEQSGFEIIETVNTFQSILSTIMTLKPDIGMFSVNDLGRDTLRKLRQEGNWLPIIIVTSKEDSYERIAVLEEGADDYLGDYFDQLELVARLRAILRRTDSHSISLNGKHTIVKSGKLKLDWTARRVWLGNDELSLTPKAVAVLQYLMTHTDELITREQLLTNIWGWDYPESTRSVDARIAELRRVLKIDEYQLQCIETVLGQGYRFINLTESDN